LNRAAASAAVLFIPRMLRDSFACIANRWVRTHTSRAAVKTALHLDFAQNPACDVIAFATYCKSRQSSDNTVLDLIKDALVNFCTRRYQPQHSRKQSTKGSTEWQKDSTRQGNRKLTKADEARW